MNHSVLPALSAGCRISVVIPARDEEQTIGATLAALTTQCDVDGSALPRGLFDITIFANRCSDRTGAVVRRLATRTPEIPITVIEDSGAAVTAHIGTARKHVMDLAATRFLAAGMPGGIVASIDADTVADNYWIAWIAREMRGRDAVAGHVTIAAADRQRLLAPVRLLYARELAYRRAFADIESLVDPLPHDPYPRHASFVGASFAVTAGTYVAAGGLPPLPRLEDLEFLQALRRIDARVRHSPYVRATTSARQAARVDGGFGTFVAELHACARRGESFLVEHPLRTLEDIESRAAVRRIWSGDARGDDVARVAAIFALAPRDWLGEIDPTAPLGTTYERIARRAADRRQHFAPVRVETAIATLRECVRTAGTRESIVQPTSKAGRLVGLGPSIVQRARKDEGTRRSATHCESVGNEQVRDRL